MTPQEIKELRIKMGKTQSEFAYILGVAHATVCRWENDKCPPSKMAIKLLQEQKDKLCR